MECDILDMHVMYSLTGCGNLIEIQHIREGENTYSFVQYNNKIVLVPQVFNPLFEPIGSLSKPIILSVFGFEILKRAKRIIFCWPLILKQRVNLGKNHHPLLQALLNVFNGFSLEDLPNKLPPLRNIQHQIDLILGVKLHNLAHYRMRPREHEILHGMVDELLERKLMKENLNPCVVHTLQVLKKDATCRICVDIIIINKIIVKYKFTFLDRRTFQINWKVQQLSQIWT